MRRSTRLATSARTGVSGPSQASMPVDGDASAGKVEKKRVRKKPAEKSRAAFDELHRSRPPQDPDGPLLQGGKGDQRLAEKKWLSWAPTATTSPFPDFHHPTPMDCNDAYQVLNHKHRAAVEEEFEDPNTPQTIPFVLDAMMVALLSQATSWSNAKRAMNSMKTVYGSVFAYDGIVTGGRQKLEDTIRCGGLHVRKSTLIFFMLQQVQERHGSWDLNYLFHVNDEDAMQELLSYKGIGPKCAFVVMGWCLKRNPFTVDTHVFRIAGLWGWIPAKTTREKAQAHLDAMVPKELKFDLHFLLIAHGRTCATCRGGSRGREKCEAQEEMNAKRRERGELPTAQKQ